MKSLNKYKFIIAFLAITATWSNTVSAQIIISELMYDPCGAQGPDGDCEYIEIFNSYTTPYDLCGASLMGVNFTFPCNGTAIIPSGGYFIVNRSPGNCGTPPVGYDISSNPYNYVNSFVMGGEPVSLTSCGGVILADIGVYPIDIADGDCNSLNNDGSGTATFYAESATPGTTNVPGPSGTTPLAVGSTPAPNCEISDVIVGVATCNGSNAEVTVSWTEENTNGTVEVDIDGNGFMTMTNGGTYPITGPTTAATGVTVTVRDQCNNLCMATTTVDIPTCPVPCVPVNTNGDIFITEIMYNGCNNQLTGEFIEICNKSTTVTYDIGGFEFQDNTDAAGAGGFSRHEVPDGTMLTPGACYVTPVGAFAMNLTNMGEDIAILDNCDNLVDVVTYLPGTCAGRYSLSLVDWQNQTTLTNDDMANYAPGADVGESFAPDWLPSAGGSPGEPNTYGACIDVPSTLTAVCNADFTISFEIAYTDANNAPFSPIVLEVYDGTTLFATSAPNSMIAGNAVFTIPGQEMQNGLVLTIQPQEGTIEQGCVSTEFTLNIPECGPPECEITDLSVSQICAAPGTGDHSYDLEICFTPVNGGASGMFEVFLDPPATNEPVSSVGVFTPDAAGCITITGGDAVDLESGLQLCVVDADNSECLSCTNFNEFFCVNCDITAAAATASSCNNNATLPDASDDFFTFTLDVTQGDPTLPGFTFDGTALGLSANETGTYGAAGYASPNISLNGLAGMTIPIIIIDTTDPTCAVSVDIVVPATCSACPIMVNAFPTCPVGGAEDMFDIEYNITGGVGPYTINGMAGLPAAGILTDFTYTAQNDKITLTVADEGNPGCMTTYDVLQLSCASQTTCLCEVFDIRAQAAGNGDGYSMYYVLVDPAGAILAANETGDFPGLPHDVVYTVNAINIEDADLASLAGLMTIGGTYADIIATTAFTDLCTDASCTANFTDSCPSPTCSTSSTDACVGEASGTATVTAASGTAPYTYLWDAAAADQTIATATNLAAGTYTVTVTDDAGCTVTCDATVIESANCCTPNSGIFIRN